MGPETHPGCPSPLATNPDSGHYGVAGVDGFRRCQGWGVQREIETACALNNGRLILCFLCLIQRSHGSEINRHHVSARNSNASDGSAHAFVSVATSQQAATLEPSGTVTS